MMTSRGGGAPAPARRSGSSAAGRRPAGRGRSAHSSAAWPVLFVGPLLFGILLFYVWPIFRNLYISFTQTGPFGGSTWTGLANYQHLLSDPELGGAILHTFIFTAIVLLGVPIAMFLAALINRPRLRFSGVYRTIFFLPYVAMPVAIAQVWKIIFNGDYGVLNWFLGLVGIKSVYWVSTPGWALVATAVVGLWLSLGFNMIVLLAALKGVPPEMYEAAALDGAGPWRQFKSITIPMISRTTFFLMVVTTIGGLQLFDLLFVLVGKSNPAMPQTQSLVFMFWNQSFQFNNQGYGAAIAVAIMVIIGVVTAGQFILQRKWVQDV